MKRKEQFMIDNGLFDAFPNADKVLKELLFTTRKRPDLEKVNDVIQLFCS